MSIFDSNIFQNPVPRRYLDYSTNFPVPFKPKGIDIEGRTKPVTDISEIAPTGSTKSVLAEGIANAALRNKFDFNKSFSTLVQGSGQPYIRDASKTYDYPGHKLGNPIKSPLGYGREFWETAKTVALGHAPNIIANTLGDYTVNYTPKLDPNHPEVMNIYDQYDFVGKSGEGRGSPYDINVNLSPAMIAKIKKQHFINRKKQQSTRQKNTQMQRAAEGSARLKAVLRNIKTYGTGDRPNIGITTPGGGKLSPTGGDVAGTPFARGGRASYFDGGLASLWLR